MAIMVVHDKILFGKKTLSIIKNASDIESYFPIFKELQIMILPCLYMYYCLLSVKNNLNNLIRRQDILNHSTRKKLVKST